MKLMSVSACDFCNFFASFPTTEEPTVKIDDGCEEDNEPDSFFK